MAHEEIEELKQEAKEFAKVEDDDIAFDIAFDAALETVEGAVGTFHKEKARERLLLCMVTQNFYDNRSILSKKTKEGLSYIVRTMMLQLQLEVEDEDGN